MTDPIICRHIGRSTWQGPASAAPRKEDRMNHAAHPDALQEARNAALREAADAAKGEGESEFFNPVQAIRALIDTPAPQPACCLCDDRPQAPNDPCGACGRSAPPAEPAGDALREALTRDLNALRAAASRGPVSSREIFQMTDPMMDRLSRAALAAAPAPIQPAPQPDALREATNLATVLHRKHYAADAPNWKPEPDLMGLLLQIDNMTAGLTRAPQPDADEREAMVAVIYQAGRVVDYTRAAEIADALLAAGWTRKRGDE